MTSLRVGMGYPAGYLPMRPMNMRIVDRTPWVVSGFGIGVSVSLVVCFGVDFLLSMVTSLKFPEHQVLIFTVLFYGVIFIVAHSGVRAGTRRNRALISRNSMKDFSATPMGSKSATARAKTALWNIVTVVSVIWLTPALVIYWIAPRHPDMSITVCCFIFSLAGATGVLFKTGRQKQTAYNTLMFFVGVCSGILAVVHFFPFS